MPTAAVINEEETELQRRSTRVRLFQLDSLRGLAAFCVIWYHLRLCFPVPRSHNLLLALFTSGSQAVQLFFVLSGYVLSLPYWAGKKTPYGSYLLRRFFRIYIPYFFALLFAWVLAKHFLFSHLPLQHWFYKTWQTPLTGKLFLSEIGMSMTPAVNTAFWSLRIEAEFSILLPLCCWLVRRAGTVGTLLLCAASYTVATRLPGSDLTVRLFCFPMFFLGMLLSYHAKGLAEIWRGQTKLVHFAWMLTAFVLYLHFLPVGKFSDALTGLGACLAIVGCLHSQMLSQLLRHAVPEYLGRISYSLYLVHGTVLFTAMNLLYGKVSISLLVGIYGIVAILVAHIFCVLVEEPAMHIGRRVTAR